MACPHNIQSKKHPTQASQHLHVTFRASFQVVWLLAGRGLYFARTVPRWQAGRAGQAGLRGMRRPHGAKLMRSLKRASELLKMMSTLSCGSNCWIFFDVPSGKHTKNYGKSPCVMGKSTISMAIFHSYVKLPEGISQHFLIHNSGLQSRYVLKSTSAPPGSAVTRWVDMNCLWDPRNVAACFENYSNQLKCTKIIINIMVHSGNLR